MHRLVGVLVILHRTLRLRAMAQIPDRRPIRTQYRTTLTPSQTKTAWFSGVLLCVMSGSKRLYHILQVEDRLTASLVQHNLDFPWPVFKALQPWPDQVTTRIRHCHYRLYRRNQDGIEIPQSHHVAIAFDESAM
ncbi:hypothetical protein EV361DRAFT_425466 [Lentinula raphanica]|nr:hypothetical protein EV361DRAFT_425466 [Lentinula raphanica]